LKKLSSFTTCDSKGRRPAGRRYCLLKMSKVAAFETFTGEAGSSFYGRQPMYDSRMGTVTLAGISDIRNQRKARVHC
jgi:hypothetical protein